MKTSKQFLQETDSIEVNRIYNLDCMDLLRQMENESVHCCVTSPPYWNLRDYGINGQLGLEETPEEYIKNMADVFREVRRVLRNDGTLWLNMGDCYASGGRGGGADDRKQHTNVGCLLGSKKPPPGLKPKDLCGIPWMLAFALRDDGWYLRMDIVWAKPNPMPESVTDRPTKAHEYLFLMTKSQRYYYDAHAIMELATKQTSKMPDGWDTDPGGHGLFHRKGREKGRKTDKQRGHSRRHAGFNDRWDQMTKAEQAAAGRNKRSVWTVATQPMPEAHFATFPEKLIKPCILAGTSLHGICAQCSAPYARIVKKGEQDKEWAKTCGADKSGGYSGKATKDYAAAGAEDPSAVKARILKGMCKKKTVGWQQTCECETREVVKPLVLDPFMGAGTTALVAKKLSCNFIGSELNPNYIKIAEKRLKREYSLF